VRPQVSEAINPAVGCYYLLICPASPPIGLTKLYCLVTEVRVCVNNLPRVALGSAAAGIRTRDMVIASPAP